VPRLYKVLQQLKYIARKKAKVSAVFSDKEGEGKITVGKGGGINGPAACPSKITANKILRHWQERQNKKPRRGEKSWPTKTLH
jgi:hypothetical protein